jgi:lipopolysaccharide/colanic/teichoic acid biosynthesis glycosyltransferase
MQAHQPSSIPPSLDPLAHAALPDWPTPRRNGLTGDGAGDGSRDLERPLVVAREPECEPWPAPVAEAASPERVPTAAEELAETLRRALNVLVAAVAIVALAPLFALIAIVVRLSSPGPIIYVQERVGIDRRRASRDRRAGGAAIPVERRVEDVGGRPYRMFKFRTMRIDAESDGRAVWATRDDPRVTPVGRLLRGTRLDELPQFVNVLRGEMNVVGPRPERPPIAAQLRREIDGYALRYRVRPGITGWAQINHPYDGSLDDVRTKVRYDLEYLGRRGVTEDLKILARTVPVMLGRRTGW